MKKVVFILTLFLSSLAVFAQDEPTEGSGFQKDRLFVGGNFGLSFGDYTLINITPQVGYRFSSLFAAGLGINGQYISVKNYYTTGSSRTEEGVTGLNIFGRLYPLDQIMIQVQPEMNYRFGNIKYYDVSGSLVQKTKADAVIVPSLLIGGGAVFPSGRGALIASVFYDVLQDKNSPYGARPFYTFGYNFSF
jgi:hypothetical protein